MENFLKEGKQEIEKSMKPKGGLLVAWAQWAPKRSTQLSSLFYQVRAR